MGNYAERLITYNIGFMLHYACYISISQSTKNTKQSGMDFWLYIRKTI